MSKAKTDKKEMGGFKVKERTPYDPNKRDTIYVKNDPKKLQDKGHAWWLQKDPAMMTMEMLNTAEYLAQSQQYRVSLGAIYSRLYSNMTTTNLVGMQSRFLQTANLNLPQDRPTYNVVSSCTDTLVSNMTQSKPRPIFLTDNSDYRERRTAKDLNAFIQGEFYRTKAYEIGAEILRDACEQGTGVIKIFEKNKKVHLERVLQVELYVDANDGMYRKPRTLYQKMLMDRAVAVGNFPSKFKMINMADQATLDNASANAGNVSDEIMLWESWHLPSSETAKDGRHVIACSHGLVLDEEWEEDDFPFVFYLYAPNTLGFWAEGLASRLMGNQYQINKLLITISRAQSIVGVPRVFVENSSKFNSAHFDDQIGTICKFTGTKPTVEVFPCVPPELYAERDKLVQYSYEQEGISQLNAAAQKPAGLDSGEAIRQYDDIQSVRFTSQVRKYETMYINLAYKITRLAAKIAKRDGKYETIYPSKNSCKKIKLPADVILNNPYIIQCFDSSSLPRDPAGRQAKIAEYIQSGILSLSEGRRMMDFPDLDQVETLANAAEERILKYLDKIVEDGKYTPPDPFMNIDLANTLVVQYYNLYVGLDLEEHKAQMLINFWTALKEFTAPPAPMANPPQANPQPLPTSPLVPNGNPGMAA